MKSRFSYRSSFAYKAACLVCMVLFLNTPLWAQITFSGTVSSPDRAPVPYAIVALLQEADSSLVKAGVSDENGDFRLLEVPQGRYLLRISSVGYQTLFQSVSPTDAKMAFTILEDAQLLNEVQVVAQKPLVEVLADKTVFNVEGTLSASGLTAFELLRKAPGVLIDNSENLIVEGRGGVQVYIDGKLSPLTGQDLADYLKTLQANDVEAIEIITQPSSKYDAAGNAGILNIKLKKNKNYGTNGTLNAGYGIGRFSKYNTGISLNHRNKKVNLFANYSNNLGKNYSFINLYRIQSNTIFDAQSNNISHNQSHNTKLGLDFYAGSKSTFGVILNGNFNDFDAENRSVTPIIAESTQQNLQVLRAESNTLSSTYNLNANLNYRYADKVGRSLSLDFDYGKYSNDRTNLQPNFYFDGNESNIESQFIYRMITPVSIQIASFKADFEHALWGGKLGLGLKSSQVATDNTFEFYDVIDSQDLIDLNRSNRFGYVEQVHAAYFNFNRKWGKTNLQFGLRAEQTYSEGDLKSLQQTGLDNVQRAYLDFFPSAGLTYALNPQNSLALTYSRRIDRPNYRTLNPFEMQIDELSFSQGNPFLQPQYTHNLKLSHTFKYTLNTSLSYSRTSDFIAQVTDAIDDTRSRIQPQNIANQEVINLGISYPFNITQRWSAFVSLNAFRSSFEAQDERFLAITQNTLSLYGQQNFTLPKGFQFEVSGWYSSPSVWGGTYQTRSLGSLDLALQKKFAQDKLSVRVAVSDIFFTAPWRGDTRFADVFIRGNGGWESRQFRLNLSYNFGSSTVKALKLRKTGIEEERERVE